MPRCQIESQIIRDLFNPTSGNGMSYVRVPVSLMSDFMAADGGGEYCYVDDWDATLDTFRYSAHDIRHIGGNFSL